MILKNDNNIILHKNWRYL